MTDSDIIQIVLMGLLVIVTGIYAWRTHVMSKATSKQADASVKMAEEMREQRRPIVVQEAIEPKGAAISFGDAEDIEITPSDYFQIHNIGNVPAIELEIILLKSKEKKLPEIQKKTFLRSDAETPVVFTPHGLEEFTGQTCYLLCRYRSVLSPDEKQIWYETWLPFTPKKSQRGDRIIIAPEELYFCEEFEKKSY
ncbi:hypothetical protein ACFLVH_00145 [Chloroflexota bacterium]